MITVNALTFALNDCAPKKPERGIKRWRSINGVGYILRLLLRPADAPLRWTFDLTDIAAAREFYQKETAENKGVLLSLDTVSAGGVEALCGVFKYRDPTPGSLAMYFCSILYVPFQNSCFQIIVEAMERGTTGMREAVVFSLEPPDLSEWEDAPEPEPLEEGESWEEVMRAAPLKILASDEERWDGQFPDHPLSQVRVRMADVIATLQIDPEVRALKPFRIGEA